LPKGVDRRLTTLFDYLRKARRFHFEELHIPAIRGAPGCRALPKKSPPENYGKEDQTTVAAFLPWRGS